MFFECELLRRQPVLAADAGRPRAHGQRDRVAVQAQRTRGIQAARQPQLAEHAAEQRVDAGAVVGHLRVQHRAVEFDLAAALCKQHVAALDHLVGTSVAGLLRLRVLADVLDAHVAAAGQVEVGLVERLVAVQAHLERDPGLHVGLRRSQRGGQEHMRRRRRLARAAGLARSVGRDVHHNGCGLRAVPLQGRNLDAPAMPGRQRQDDLALRGGVAIDDLQAAAGAFAQHFEVLRQRRQVGLAAAAAVAVQRELYGVARGQLVALHRGGDRGRRDAAHPRAEQDAGQDSP